MKIEIEVTPQEISAFVGTMRERQEEKDAQTRKSEISHMADTLIRDFERCLMSSATPI